MESHIIELHGPRRLVITTKEIVSKPRVGIVARTLYSAVSTGTELAAYSGLPGLRPGPVYPRLMGYCNVAEVHAVGDDITTCRPGDRILTFQSHRSSFVCSEQDIILVIPPTADLPATAITYLFHLGYNALLKGDFVPGFRVAVVGLGCIGLCAVTLSSLFGGRTYALSDQAASLEFAASFGAVPVPKGDWQREREGVLTSTYDDGIDLVINTSNTWADWKLGLELARKGGRICVLGFPGRGEQLPDFNPLDSQFFYDKQLSLVACGYTPDLITTPQDLRFTIRRNCRFLHELIVSGKLPAHRFISQTRPWYEIDSVYAVAAERKRSFLTCILDWTAER